MRVLFIVSIVACLVLGAMTVGAEESVSERLGRLERIVADLQQGALVPFVAGQCPDGWVRYHKADGRFLIGTTADDTYGEPILYGDLGGEFYHTHTGTTNGVGGRGSDNDSDFTAAVPHSHSYTTDATFHTPRYVGVIFCQLPPGF